MRGIAILAVAMLLPGIAGAASEHIAKVIETPERVIYTVSGSVPGAGAARLWSDASVAEATADCTERKGVLNTCSAVCGLNGCFTTCTLACEFPDEIEKRRGKIISEYQAAKTFYGRTSIANGMVKKSGSKSRISKAQHDAAAQRFNTLAIAVRAENGLLESALNELHTGVPAGVSAELAMKRKAEIETTLARMTEARFGKECKATTLPSSIRRQVSPSPAGMLSAKCDPYTDDILLTAGTGSSTMRILKNGRTYGGSKHGRLRLDGAVQEGVWYRGSAHTIISSAVQPPAKAAAVFACTGNLNECVRTGKWYAIGLSGE